MPDQVRKSKTGGAKTQSDPANPPAFDEIAKRAHDLWLEKGCPTGSAEHDWFEAEHQLMLERHRRTPIPTLNDKTGSVQA